MTPKQISNLKEGDRVIGLPVTDIHKAEVVERTLHGVMILWENGDEKHYALEDAPSQTCIESRSSFRVKTWVLYWIGFVQFHGGRSLWLTKEFALPRSSQYRRTLAGFSASWILAVSLDCDFGPGISIRVVRVWQCCNFGGLT
jgi:hypothetical protein